MAGRGPQSFSKKLQDQQVTENQREKAGVALEARAATGAFSPASEVAREGRVTVKARSSSSGDRGRPTAAPAEPKEILRGLPDVSDNAASGRQTSKKAPTGKDRNTALHLYRFQRSRTPGIIEVLNEHMYVMAEYSQRTGSVKWQRIVLASQREQVEKWLEDHYPRG